MTGSGSHLFTICGGMNTWMFPKIVGFPPKSSILIRCSIIFTIHFGFFIYFWKRPNVLGVYICHPPDSRILKNSGYVESSLFHVPNSRCKDFHDMKYPLRIHGTGIFTYIWVIFKWLNVGKYTSPMDPS